MPSTGRATRAATMPHGWSEPRSREGLLTPGSLWQFCRIRLAHASPGGCRHSSGVHRRHRQQPCGARLQARCAICNDSENVECGDGIGLTALASRTAGRIPLRATETGGRDSKPR
jgi:hypothetical protein